jgi:hypothetical protein
MVNGVVIGFMAVISRRGDRCHFRKKLYLVNGAGEQRLPLQVFDVTSPDDFLHSCQA